MSMHQSLWVNRHLLKQLTKRDILTRYRGSYLGVFWSVLNPLLMMAVYTFVFSVIFKAKWGSQGGGKAEFGLILFCGISAFNFFAEMVTRAPVLIAENVNYVKKVVFPLEILPVVALGSALMHLIISLILLVLGLVSVLGIFNWTIVCLPLVLLPLFLWALGLSWVLASLGVYIRDIGQIVGVGVQALMFLSPVFYSVNSIPQALRPIYFFNPLSFIIDDMRRIFIWGQLPNWNGLLINVLIGLLVTYCGFNWFQKTRGGFADVL